MTEETGEEDRLLQRLVDEAVKNVFDQHFSAKQFSGVVEFFENGGRLTIADTAPTEELLGSLDAIRGFRKVLQSAASDLVPELAKGDTASGAHAAIAELILDGLYGHNRVNKTAKDAGTHYGV
jgi:magnesium chelatase subunit I